MNKKIEAEEYVQHHNTLSQIQLVIKTVLLSRRAVSGRFHCPSQGKKSGKDEQCLRAVMKVDILLSTFIFYLHLRGSWGLCSRSSWPTMYIWGLGTQGQNLGRETASVQTHTKAARHALMVCWRRRKGKSRRQRRGNVKRKERQYKRWAVGLQRAGKNQQREG